MRPAFIKNRKKNRNIIASDKPSWRFNIKSHFYKNKNYIYNSNYINYYLRNDNMAHFKRRR